MATSFCPPPPALPDGVPRAIFVYDAVNWDYRCRLWSAAGVFATDDHIATSKHQSRLSSWEYYLDSRFHPDPLDLTSWVGGTNRYHQRAALAAHSAAPMPAGTPGLGPRPPSAWQSADGQWATGHPDPAGSPLPSTTRPSAAGPSGGDNPVTSLHARLDTLDAALTATNIKVENLEIANRPSTTRPSANDNPVTELQVRLDALDAALTATNVKVDNLEIANHSSTTGPSGGDAVVTELRAMLERMDVTLKETNVKVENLETTIAVLKEQLLWATWSSSSSSWH